MELKERTRNFALRIIRLVGALPSNRIADVIGRQILKSGTSPGAHFREAIRARSKSEYVAKLNGGLMELEETLYWLEILEGSKLVAATKLESLKQETLPRSLYRSSRNGGASNAKAPLPSAVCLLL